MEPMTIEQEKIEQLREIDKNASEANARFDQRSAAFLEGRGFEVTKGLDEHPRFWSRPCQCNTCNSYDDT
jgi:hypothetical protein